MSLHDADIYAPIIIVDNNKYNLGFTHAVNTGISRSTGDYIWLLNSDAIVLPGALDALIKRMESDSTCGIAGSMQIDPDDKNTIRHGGTSQAYPYGIHKGGKVSAGDCRVPERQKWVNFASVLIRKKMIDLIGLLDENYFMYYSDSDYCYQARMTQWTVWYEPESKVLHRLNASANPDKSILDKDKKHFEDKWLGNLADNWHTLDLLP
jgi:GT2 family glycosyltransferase